MRGARPFLVSLLALWVAGALQQALAPRLALGPVMPDFPLIVIAALAPLLGRRNGTILGFGAGLVHGALAGANLAAYTITRALAGFLIGWLRDTGSEERPTVAAVAGAVATVFVGIVMVFVAPPASIGAFLFGTIGAAVVNGALASLVHALLRRFVERQGL